MDQTDESLATALGNPPPAISGSHSENPSATPRPSLTADVARFLQQIKTNHPERLRLRPKALKTRILFLIDQALPPHRRKGGRPRNERITRAVEMFRAQQEEIGQGKGSKVNWPAIVRACVPGFAEIRSQYRRRTELDRLQNSVYARLNRKRPYKRKRSLSGPKTPAIC